MTVEVGPEELFGAIGRALDDVEAGRRADCVALRAMLAHVEDQVGASGRNAPELFAGVMAGLAAFFRELPAVVDRLEIGDADGARAAFQTAMHRAFDRPAEG